MSNGFTSIEEIKRACKKVDSGVAQDTIFMYKCYPFLCEQHANNNKQLAEIIKLLKKRSIKKIKKKRRPNAWSKFAGEYLRAGKTLQEAARDWKTKKGQEHA